MAVLPGLKTVRLSGILKRPPISDTSNNAKSKKLKDFILPTRDTGDDLDALRGAINTLYERLKEFYRQRKSILLEIQLYFLKKRMERCKRPTFAIQLNRRRKTKTEIVKQEHSLY